MDSGLNHGRFAGERNTDRKTLETSWESEESVAGETRTIHIPRAIVNTDLFKWRKVSRGSVVPSKVYNAPFWGILRCLCLMSSSSFLVE